jgi:hypothetical protein
MNMWLRREKSNIVLQHSWKIIRYSIENVSNFVTINANLQLIDPSKEWDTEDSDDSDVAA